MNAITLIQTLVLTEYSSTKLETAKYVLNELYNMKELKEAPFLTINRAIKIQKRTIKGLE